MTKTRKRLLALIIIFTMLFSYFIPISSVIATGTDKPNEAEWLIDEGDNHVWYKIDGTTLTIGGSGKMPDWDATTYATQPWREHNITDVVIENGITNIGVYSFMLMSSIKNVSFPNSLTEIGTAAFIKCGLKSVTLNEGLTTIDASAFSSNSNLIEVIFPTTLTSIGIEAFQDCDIKNIVFPEGLISIGTSAFSYNADLNSVVLPSSLSEIGNKAFMMTGLRTIISYSKTPPTIGDNVFAKKNSFILDSIQDVVVPYDSVDDYMEAYRWDYLFNTIGVPVEAYIIKTNISGAGKGTVIPSVKHILVNEYNSQNINLNIIPSSNSYLKSLAVIDEGGKVVPVSNNSFTMPECNVEIKAIFDTKINVTYNLNGGSGIEEEEITYGDKINKPTDPTKTGYTFDGWYEDEELNNVFNFDATITNDITLYAKWKANEYKVKFDANEGTVIPENKNVTFNSTYGDLPIPTRDGYTFDGWFTAKENGTEIKSDTTVSITENQTLFAKWLKNVVTYSVTFKDGENELFTRSNITSGEKVTRPEVDPAKEGYEFKGWYADATLTIEFDFNAPITQNTCVYAKYEKTQENPPLEPGDITDPYDITVNVKLGYQFIDRGPQQDFGIIIDKEAVGNDGKVTVNKAAKHDISFIVAMPNELDTLKVNGVEVEKKDFGKGYFGATVDEASSYELEITVKESVSTTIIWGNPGAIKDDTYTDDCILEHGSAKIIAVYDKNGNLIEDALPPEMKATGGVSDDHCGYAIIDAGCKVVFEFVPEYGYQLTKVLANETELEAQNTMNQYIFTMPDTNVHFQATFTKVEDIVKADSKKVSSGEIVLANNELDAGTARLSVKDIELSNDKVKEFKNAAGEYEIKSYLDIDLDQIFYKGSNDESNVWEKKIDTLSNKATITLKLADGITADDIVIVHNIHDGDNYEIIEIENYDPETNTITFKTNSFSNYAIATKTSSNTNNDTPTNTNDNPKTGDNIYVYISLMTFAMVGIIITSKSLKKSK